MHEKSWYGREFGKKVTARLVLGLWACQLVASGTVFGAPTGGVVTSGSAAINQSGSVTNVNQSTNAATINWTSFSTAPTETVNFNQPSASSITLNRVIGNEASVLQGALNATGKVFLINSNGILMTKGSTVNTAGFVASTLNLSDNDFNAGNYVFKANGSTGSVVNMGTITAKDGGYVAMLGNSVSNQGVITATKGTVALAGGDKITLNFNGDSLVSVTVDEGTLNALVENKEAIYADGGKVILTAKAADELLSAQVNNSGVIQARTVDDLKGSIELYAHGGTTTVTGTLDASAPTAGDGGAIETSGDHVKIADNAVITTKSATGKSGSWLIDPDGFTVGINGDISATALTTALANGNVTIASTSGSGTDGNIDIDGAVSWSKNTLTLNATNNIYVNAAMTASGSAGLIATYGTGTNSDGTPMGLYTLQAPVYSNVGGQSFTGKINFSGSGGVKLNGVTYTVITSTAQLMAITNLAGNYVLGSDLDASDLMDWSLPGTFTGKFNGFGHVINSPFTTYSDTTKPTGLFDTIGAGAVVSNMGIDSAYIEASAASTYSTVAAAGILANYNHGSIVNDFVSNGTIYNSNNITAAGALVGDNYGLIAQCYAYNTQVAAASVAGGLVGINEASGTIIDSATLNNGNSSNTTIINYDPNATISYVGGLVGENYGSIKRSYSQSSLGLMDSTSTAGCFVGLNAGTIDQCYASKFATSSYNIAPFLAGFVWDNTGTITNSYTTALYTKSSDATSWDAGFAYRNSGTIKNAYATEYATDSTGGAKCGFACYNTSADGATTGTIKNAYWYAAGARSTTTVNDTSAATQLTSASAATYSSYSGFDSLIWAASVSGYPILSNILLIVANSSTAVTYGSATSVMNTLAAVAQGLQGGGGDDFKVDVIRYTNSYNAFTPVTSNGYVDAGSWDPSALFTSSAYKKLTGLFTVNQKALYISASGDVAADKVYDGTTAATLNSGVTLAYSGLIGSQTLTPASAAFADKNAGADKSVTLTFTSTTGGKASNYAITYTSPTYFTASIAKKTITFTVDDIAGVDKIYNGTTAASISYTLPGAVSGDSLALGYSASFADKNAGTGKTVTVSGLTLSGTDSGNYTLSSASTLTTTAAINPLALVLYGIKGDDGSSVIPASNITATNIISGDTVTIGGSATISGTTAGLQTIKDTSGLTVNNPNYTVVGSVGNVLVGGASLVLNNVASGTAAIATTTNASGGTDTTVTTSTDKTVIDWTRFNIASGETVTFAQPAATSIVLNRVVGYEASAINGALASNGRVFIINSNGILFAAGSSVNTAGLVASALQLTDANFNSDNYVFTVADSASGSVVAKGDIIIADGGFLALMSNNGVTTSGSVTATNGKVMLASADQVTLTLNSADTGLAGYALSGLDGATTVGGVLNAAGGLIETAGKKITAASGLAITSDTWSWTQDAVTIGGDFSAALVSSAPALGNLILNAVTGDITVNDAITWATDTKLTLNAANDIAVNKAITASGANAALALNAGNGITVNKAITATGANAKLALTAGKDIAIDADIVLSGANAALTMTYGGDYSILTPATYSGAVLDKNGIPVANTVPTGTEYASITLSGANAGLTINGNRYTLLHSMADLAALDDATGTATGYFALAQNIDASGVTYTSSPIAALSGTLAGLGHTVSKLTITAASTDYAGLIGQATASAIRDIGVVDAIYNTGAGGILAGKVTDSTVSHAYTTGTMTGGTGGLLGGVKGSTISYSYSNADGSTGGGLIGTADSTTVEYCHATGNVTNGSGGLIGATSSNAYIANSYAIGKVGNGSASNVGGLVGYFAYGNSIVNSFAEGEVSGTANVGGLVGWLGIAKNGTTIDNCHAIGKVTAAAIQNYSNGGAGGLIGTAETSDTGSLAITTCYATGDVTGSSYIDFVGGLVGKIESNGRSTITHSYATGNVLSKSTKGYAGGLVGALANTDLNYVHSTGTVTGGYSVGGVSGFVTGVTMNNSYASGVVVGTDGATRIGGLIGGGYATGGNNYWNSDGPGSAGGGGVISGDNNRGLTSEQMKDIDFYIDHTIGQVLQGRADDAAKKAEAAREAQLEDAAELGGDILSQTGQSVSRSSRSSLSAQADAPLTTSSIDSQIEYADSASYSADIDSINADGVQYDLRDGAKGKDKDKKK